MPSREYDLVFEEAIAYTITTIVLLLTIMLVYEIHDVRGNKSIKQTRVAQDFINHYMETNEPGALEYLSVLLGVATTPNQAAQTTTRK